MKKKSVKHLYVLPVVFVFTFFLSGCREEGCTDPKAINFSIVADVDDGSCIVCTGVQYESGYITGELTDFNFSSPHYNEVVARYYLRQIKDSYNNSACGTPKQCNLYFKIESLVNQSMDFTYRAQFNGNTMFFVYSRFISLTPLETTLEDIIPISVSNSCGSFDNGFLSFSANNTIIYH